MVGAGGGREGVCGGGKRRVIEKRVVPLCSWRLEEYFGTKNGAVRDTSAFFGLPPLKLW